MSEDNRRIKTRKPAEIKVDYRTIGSFMTDYSKDISNGGVFIQTSLPLPPGQSVRLRITLPNRDLPFSLEGIVRWSRPAVDGEPSPGMGVEFMSYDKETKDELDRFMASLKASKGE